MRLWEVIKEILRNKKNDGTFVDFMRMEYPEYRKEGSLPRFHSIKKG